jgi:flagellar motor protein MotB
MQRFSAVIVVALAACLALVSVGCVDEAKYNAVLLRNREQEKLLQEKEADLATLNERVSALQARAADAQRMLQEKEDHLATVMKERDEVRKAFDELMGAYKKLAGGMYAPSTKIPKEVAISIQQLADQYPGLFEFDAATGRLRFASDITFDSGSNVVKAGARGAIAKLGGILSSDIAKGIIAAIIGHTDTDPVKKATTKALLQELGKPTTNQGLSEARAEAVADVLKGAGVEATRMDTRGVGSAQKIADNNTAAGKAKNRRVEIFLSMGP